MHREEVPKEFLVNIALAYHRAQGFKAGLMGLSRDTNPEVEGSAPWRSWDVGWRRATDRRFR